MISIPLYVLLFIYFIFLAVFAIFVIINIYHLAMTGSITFISFFVMMCGLVLSAFVIFATWYLLQGTSWQTSVTLINFGGASWSSFE